MTRYSPSIAYTDDRDGNTTRLATPSSSGRASSPGNSKKKKRANRGSPMHIESTVDPRWAQTDVDIPFRSPTESWKDIPPAVSPQVDTTPSITSPRTPIKQHDGQPASSPSSSPGSQKKPQSSPLQRVQSMSPRTKEKSFIPVPPTAEYLATSADPSEPIALTAEDYPRAHRKLLVLDLNGTLLYRTRSTNRAIHPRPYMRVFARYLEQYDGIESMVWSSAQGVNVQRMVSHAFGDLQSSLKAVWGRETLGLSRDDFSRNVQTVKDLRVLWEKLPMPSPPHPGYSAINTVLLDDSTKKAHRQPYNHLPLPEYNADLFSRDSRLEQGIRNTRKPKSSPFSSRARKSDASTTPDPPTSSINAVDETPPLSSLPLFDRTLVAVIGILDEISRQTNVAGWIRNGGLWAGFKDAAHTAFIAQEQKSSDSFVDPIGAGVGNEAALFVINENGPDTGAEDSVDVKVDDGPHTQTKVLSGSDQTASAVEQTSKALAKVESRKEKKRRRRERRAAEQAGTSPIAIGQSNIVETKAMPGDASETNVPQTNLSTNIPKPNFLVEPLYSIAEEPPAWFNYNPCFEHWAALGFKALERMDIPADPGVPVPSSLPPHPTPATPGKRRRSCTPPYDDQPHNTYAVSLVDYLRDHGGFDSTKDD